MQRSIPCIIDPGVRLEGVKVRDGQDFGPNWDWCGFPGPGDGLACLRGGAWAGPPEGDSGRVRPLKLTSRSTNKCVSSGSHETPQNEGTPQRPPRYISSSRAPLCLFSSPSAIPAPQPTLLALHHVHARGPRFASVFHCLGPHQLEHAHGATRAQGALQ